MATRSRTKPTAPSAPPQLLIPHNEARDRLQARVELGKALRAKGISNKQELEDSKREYSRWNRFNTEQLERMFSTAQYADEYSSWSGVVVMGMGTPPLGEQITEHFRDIDEKIHRIESIIERLELIPVAASVTHQTSSQGLSQPVHYGERSKKVFIVHGHDDAAKANLEALLRELGLEPVILHRQADEGLTIIEKFEKHSDVSYAFILLTPDEIAYLRKEDSLPDAERKKELRARPNVIFEFGYFVGRLGRQHVCCLHTGDVALPSDLHGLIYKKFSTSVEDAAWGIQKDLRAVGLIE